MKKKKKKEYANRKVIFGSPLTSYSHINDLFINISTVCNVLIYGSERNSVFSTEI